MKHSYQLAYRQVVLRPLEEGDIEELRVLRNRNREFFGDSHAISPEQQKVWFQKYQKQEQDFMFAVELAEQPGEFMGAIALYSCPWHPGDMEIGRTVLDKERAPARNMGTEATLAACQIAFSQIGLQRLIGRSFKFNKRVCKMNEKVGYAVTGEDEDYFYYEMTPAILRV